MNHDIIEILKLYAFAGVLEAIRSLKDYYIEGHVKRGVIVSLLASVICGVTWPWFVFGIGQRKAMRDNNAYLASLLDAVKCMTPAERAGAMERLLKEESEKVSE